MKKLVMTGTILTLALTVGTAAFAANTSPAEVVRAADPVVLQQDLSTTASSVKPESNTLADRYSTDQYHMNFMDADGDGVCDYWNEDMHDGNGHHRGHRTSGMHHGRHHGTYDTQNDGTAADYQNTRWSGGHC